MRQNLYKNNLAFFLTWGVLMVTVGVLLIVHPKPGAFMVLNSFHSDALDNLFRLITLLGDGRFTVLVALGLFFMKKRMMAFQIISSFLLSGGIVQLIKMIFSEPRPAMYFQLHGITYNHFLANVTLHNFHSFPSGHTATAFALAASLALLVKQKSAGAPLALMAFLIGYSRIYLGQHFPEDVEAGMFLGVAASVLCIVLLGRLFEGWETKLNNRK